MSVSDKLDTESVLLIAEGKKAQKKVNQHVRSLGLLCFLAVISMENSKGKILCVYTVLGEMVEKVSIVHVVHNSSTCYPGTYPTPFFVEVMPTLIVL